MRTTRLDDLLSEDATARLLAFKRDVVRALPGSVEDVVLFGSRARGDAQEDSDYDVAVLLRDGLADDQDIRGRISDVTWHCLVEGWHVQAIAMNASAFRPPRSELAMRIAAEGVPVP